MMLMQLTPANRERRAAAGATVETAAARHSCDGTIRTQDQALM